MLSLLSDLRLHKVPLLLPKARLRLHQVREREVTVHPHLPQARLRLYLRLHKARPRLYLAGVPLQAEEERWLSANLSPDLARSQLDLAREIASEIGALPAGGAQLGAQIVDLARARGELQLRPPPRLDLPGELDARSGEVDLRFGELRSQREVRSGCRSAAISLGGLREQRRRLPQPQRLA